MVSNESKLMTSALLLLVALLGIIAMTLKMQTLRDQGRETLRAGYANATTNNQD
jgi:hypothetical protein